MRILSAYCGHQNRGCWQRLKRLLLHLADTGCSVDVLVSENRGDLNRPHVRVHVLGIVGAPGWLNTLIFLAAAPVVSLFIALLRRPTRLIAFDGHNAFAMSGALLGSPRGSMFLAVRGHPKYQNTLNSYSPLQGWLLMAADRVGHRLAKRVIFNSEATFRKLLGLYQEIEKEVYILPNDIKMPSVVIEPQLRSRARADLSIDPDCVVLGFCGQFIARKNLSFLLKALDVVQGTRPFCVALKGKGPLESQLRDEAMKLGLGDRVRFLPWDDQTHVFYGLIDLFVLPSVYDDCSNSLLEAMSHGVPVFASNEGGSREIANFDSDLLFSIDDGGSDLRSKFEKVLSQPDELARLREKCLKLVERYRFNWESAMDGLMSRQSPPESAPAHPICFKRVQ